MQRILILVFLLALLSCGENIQYGAGKEDEVFVVADPGTWKDFEGLLRECLERKIPIVHQEQIFYIAGINPDELPRYRSRKNLLFVGRITGQRSSPLIQEILPSSSLEKTVEKGRGIFVVENPYRGGQTAIVITGTNNEAIRETLKNSSDILFQILWDKAKERIKERALSNLNSRLVKNLKKKYGWFLKLPSQYRVAKEEKNMVRFARHYPDRLISVYWKDGERFKPSECLEKREWFGRVFYDGDTILKDMTKMREMEMDGTWATRIDGVWQNEKHVMGGAFITLCIYDDSQNRSYLVDGLLFSPGRKKWIYITELEGIIESFVIE